MSPINDWHDEDPLDPARGVANGAGVSLVFWLVLFGGIWLLGGCEDKAFPLDCPNACGHRLD